MVTPTRIVDTDDMEICIGEDQDLQRCEHNSVNCVEASYMEHSSEYFPCLNAVPPAEECDDFSEEVEPTIEQITKDAIVNAIFQALDCIDKMGGSLNNFADLLTMARVLYCKGARLDPDDQDVLLEWPKGWSDAKKVLADVGYTDAKEYFICLNESHPCHWDILSPIYTTAKTRSGAIKKLVPTLYFCRVNYPRRVFVNGSGPTFFSFWGHSRLWPQNQKNMSPNPLLLFKSAV